MFYIQVGFNIYEFVRVKYGPGREQETKYTMNFKSVGDINNLFTEYQTPVNPFDGTNLIDFQFLGPDYGIVTYLIGTELEMKVWSYDAKARTVEEGGKLRLENWERKQADGQGKFYNYKAVSEATYTTLSKDTRKHPAKILTISTADDRL